MSDFNFLSPDSRCWSFDKRANGYARGEGSAVILLKRLDDALRNGDTIRAVIRNTGSNQDGRTLGITQPSEEAQIDLIKQTYQRAGINMAPTRFFEAHATGTPVGDPVEGNAIGTAFREYRSEHEPLYIGAVKANIGHLEGCSGLAGIIKAILVLEKGIIPPIAGFASLNDRIDAKKLHLHFPTEAVPWPTVPVRRACINSFGFGGTNAVAILDDAYHYFKLNGIQGFHRTQLGASENGQLGGLNGTQINGENQISINGVTNGVNGHGQNAENHTQNEISHTSFSGNTERTISEVEGLPYEVTPLRLLVWSASDQRGAQNISKDYKNYLSTEAVDLDDLAYTLAVRRSHFKWRNFSVVSSTDREIEPSAPVKVAANEGGIAFVFTGQGAQYLGMGRHLLSYPIFRDSLTRSDHCLRQLGCQWSLLDIVSGKVEIDIDSPEYSQPLTTCLQLALVDLLRSFDVVPSLVLGHSSGEVAAAYASGVLSSHSAIKIAYWRGQLSAQFIRQVPGLTMMAVGLSKEQTIPYLDQLYESDESLNVAVGCVNSPNSVTLTGNADQLAKLETWFEDKGIFARKLRVNVSYHSRFMNPIAEDYRKAIDELQINQSSGFVPMVSSVTGDIVTVTMLGSPDYWVRNLTSTVEFEAAFSKLLAVASTKPHKQLGKSVSMNHSLLKHVLEIGPHGALQGPIRDNMKALDGTPKLNYIASLNRSQDASSALLNAVGTLHCLGYPVNLLRANGLDDFPRPAPANIPRYPFNHTQSYWREGQLSRNLRFRSIGRHDLLGTRALDWNPLMAQWRNVMRLNELPWLEDHTIAGEIVFPAAGMISMAVEALAQLLEDDVSLQGIDIENVAFSHAISFPRGVDNIETQLTLSRPSQTPDHTKWSHFRLFVLENGSYIECCSGSIRAVVDTHDRSRVTSSGPWAQYGTLNDWIVDIDQACKGPEKNAYDIPEDVTVRYGLAFQNLEHMRVGTQGEAIAHVNTETWKLKSPGFVTPHFMVHPATLDGLAQPLLQALLAQEREVVPTMVPVRLARLWIDCSANALSVGRLKVAARCSFRGYRGGSADVVATAPDSGKPVIFLNGLETTFISSANLANPRQAASSRPLCNQLTWKPDIEAMTHEQVLLYSVHRRPRLPVDAVKDYLELMVAVTCFIQDTLAFIDEHPEIKLSWHLDAYIDWMRYQQGRLQNGEALVTEQAVQQMRDSGETRENLVKKIESSGVDGFFFMQIGRNLTKMLRGEIDPLAFMFHDGLADRYYEKMLANDHHAYPASRYIDLLSFKNPSMKILEVGAGTGGQTMRLLEAMSSDGVKKWAHYDYTDISPSFFSQARIKFAKYVDQMQFRVCNISKDPISQSFEEGSYDLVVASHVLHATDKLDESLRHLRKLLKPDGKLLLFETTRTEALQVTFAFGLLKGWWNPLQHEERSPYSPCLTVEQWDVWLKRAGFTGIDVDIPGQDEPVCRDSSIIVSSAASVVDLNTTPAPLLKIYIVVENEVKTQQALAQVLESRLSDGLGASCNTIVLADLAKASIPRSSLVIFLVEVDNFLLNDISEGDYRHLQSVLVQTKNTIWVTRADSSDDTDPRHHLVLGLGRTLMSEDSSLKFVTLTLSDNRNEEQVSTLICELTQRFVKLAVESLEGHYVVSKGVPKICRVSENAEMDTKIAQAILPRQRINCTLTPDAPVMELHLGQPGHLDTLQWREVDEMKCRDATSLGVNEVVVQVRALGLTFRDYLVASGQLDESGLGTDCSGIIQSAGEKSGFQVGDRVCLIAPSKSCTFVRITASAVIAIPPHMSFAEGASIPSALWLSYRAAVDVARIEKDETVLIDHASSCVGQMAVQVAQRLGACVLATVTEPSGPRGALLRDQLGIPDDNIFDTKDGSTISKIYQKTNGTGVDVVIGPLKDGGNGVGLDFSKCLASFGRQVDISLLRSYDSKSGPRQCSTRLPLNISQASIDMVDLIQRSPSTAHATFQRAAKMAFETNIKPPLPLHIFEASDIEVAFREFGSPESVGRRVIELNPDIEIVVGFDFFPHVRPLSQQCADELKSI
ncbi:hypothetical protein EIK77_003991 [Talaromyces pinophilus]|nr:hypothetical protein EIK77_003991 [Talaromyces pinophilus]